MAHTTYGALTFNDVITFTAAPAIGSFASSNHTHQNGAGGGTLDHGLALTGLSDDDHTQYLLASGARALTGSWAANNRIYHASAALNLGTSASTGHSLATGDVLVGGALEVDGVLWADGGLTLPSAGVFTFTSRGSISASADGTFTLLNNAGTSFSLLQLGGTTSSFPAVGRSGNLLQARLGDNSAFAPMQAAYFTPAPGTHVFDGAGLELGSGGIIDFTSSASGGVTPDVSLYRSAAGVLAVGTGGASGGAQLLLFGSLIWRGFTSTAADPTTTELSADKKVGIHKNTSSGAVYLAYNDGGVIKKVALA